jgi:small subunit ribosomal protein S17
MDKKKVIKLVPKKETSRMKKKIDVKSHDIKGNEKHQTINRQLSGEVVSNKMTKTIVVEIERMKKHPLYQKRMKILSRFKVHSREKIEVGKRVLIRATRPISKDKHWEFVKVIE